MMEFKNDLYVVDETYQSYLKKYWSGKNVDAIHLNHASITPPLPFIHRAASDIQHQNLSLDSRERLKIIERTRWKVGRLANLSAECTAFANNTTDATSLVYWLIGLHKGDTVITTDAENESIPRVFKYYMDHANPGDGWVSWQNFAQYSNSATGLIKKRRTGVKVRTAQTYGIKADIFLEKLIERIDDTTKLIVFCHVLRENGRIMPVNKICRAVHKANPNTYVLVDGAQCLGTLPKIDFRKLGCDFYVATPHKTLCSETVGILFMDQKHLELCSNINSVPREKQIIKKDQFCEKLKISPNSRFGVSLPEICALDLVIDYYQKKTWLKGNDFSAVDHHLKTLKRRLVNKLNGLNAEIESPMSPRFTNFICSFRFPFLNNREIVRRLWSENIFTSYINRSNVIRTSFSAANTLEEVDRLVLAVRKIVSEITANAPS